MSGVQQTDVPGSLLWSRDRHVTVWSTVDYLQVLCPFFLPPLFSDMLASSEPDTEHLSTDQAQNTAKKSKGKKRKTKKHKLFMYMCLPLVLAYHPLAGMTILLRSMWMLHAGSPLPSTCSAHWKMYSRKASKTKALWCPCKWLYALLKWTFPHHYIQWSTL